MMNPGTRSHLQFNRLFVVPRSTHSKTFTIIHPKHCRTVIDGLSSSVLGSEFQTAGAE